MTTRSSTLHGWRHTTATTGMI